VIGMLLLTVITAGSAFSASDHQVRLGGGPPACEARFCYVVDVGEITEG